MIPTTCEYTTSPCLQHKNAQFLTNLISLGYMQTFWGKNYLWKNVQPFLRSRPSKSAGIMSYLMQYSFIQEYSQLITGLGFSVLCELVREFVVWNINQF